MKASAESPNSSPNLTSKLDVWRGHRGERLWRHKMGGSSSGDRIAPTLPVHLDQHSGHGAAGWCWSQCAWENSECVGACSRSTNRDSGRSRPRSGVNEDGRRFPSRRPSQRREGPTPVSDRVSLLTVSAATSMSCSLRTRGCRRSWRTSPGSARSC